MRTAAEITQLLGGKKLGGGYVARCPSHDDRNPSLSLRDADGKVLVHCHAGCEQRAVLDALKDDGLWPTPKVEAASARRVETTYDYTDEHGELLYQIARTKPKGFFQRYPNGHGGWTNRKYPRQVLYRLHQLVTAPIVLVVEGERDVETLLAQGFVATTSAGGADAPWLDSYTEVLAGKEVILVPDNDSPGLRRVLRIARSLTGHVAKLVILTLDAIGVKDVSDWFGAGHSECELAAILNSEEVSR
jgi:putative DNA primase/helicase